MNPLECPKISTAVSESAHIERFFLPLSSERIAAVPRDMNLLLSAA